MFAYTPDPDIPAALAVVAHLNDEELRELLNNEQKFEDVVKDVKQLRDLESEKTTIIASNRSLAELNLYREPELMMKKQHLQEFCELAESLCLKIKGNVTELKEKSGVMTRETFKVHLEFAARESEEQSEEVATKFLNGELSINNFLEEFLQLRQIMHVRRVKFDKLPEIQQQSIPKFKQQDIQTVTTPEVTSSPGLILPYPITDPNIPGGNYGFGGIF